MSADGVLAAEQRLEQIAPGYLERVRRAASELAVEDPEADDTRAALDAVDHFADIDLDVPTGSRIPLAAGLKLAVKKLIGWYLGFFGRQLTNFGQAVSNLADILVERDERRGREVSELKAELERLSKRVDRLERPAGRRA
jgi:hypothetical protein